MCTTWIKKISAAAIVIIISLSPCEVYCGQTNVSAWLTAADIGQGKRKIYWNREYPEKSVVLEYLPTKAVDDFGVSIPVENGDIIKVTFTGNFYGNTYMGIWIPGAAYSGPVVKLTNNGTLLGGGEMHDGTTTPQRYWPYFQENLFVARANGIAVFKQEMFYNDLQDRPWAHPGPAPTVKLFDRVVIAEILDQANRSGGQWR